MSIIIYLKRDKRKNCYFSESPSASDSGCPSSEKNTDTISTGNSNSESGTSDYGSIPGAEPTPPPEPTVEYPKIRIKTTGLLKEPTSLTITEITDDNPNGDPSFSKLFRVMLCRNGLTYRLGLLWKQEFHQTCVFYIYTLTMQIVRIT